MAIGEHVFVYCWGYSHHGIDCGDGSIIHFDGGPWRAMLDQVGSNIPTICRVPIEAFAANRPVYTRPYEVTFVADQVVQRAESRIGETGYHLLGNNCEHFAVWCKTGAQHSGQAEAVVESIIKGVRQLPYSLALARASRLLPSHLRLGLYGAAISATVGRAAGTFIQRRLEHIHRGES